MRILGPDHYYRSLFDVDLDDLASRGKDTLLLDIDNTLLPRNSEVVTSEALAWGARAKARGFNVCLVSNNFHDRIVRIADELGFGLVPKALKPLPFAFWRALGKYGSTASRAVIIGDQIFTDVIGGRLLGIETVMVQPLSSNDLPHTVVLRQIERLVLRGREPQG